MRTELRTNSGRPAGGYAPRLALAALAALLLPVSLAAAQGALLESCALEGGAPARCMNFKVPEDRAKPEGRQLELKVAILPATGPQPAEDPIFYVTGGPGQSAVADGRWLAKELTAVRQRRELVLVDGRGTAGSHALLCDFPGSKSDPQGFFLDFLPAETIERCRRELEQRADLSLYSVATLVEDLEAVRQALGYPKINLIGISYGTRIALEYQQRFPQVVRTLALSGPVDPALEAPLSFAADGQRALDRLLERCSADRACGKAFPDLASYVPRALERFEKGPVEVELAAPGEPSQKVKLPRGLFTETLRFLLYNERTARRLPLWLKQAAAGDFREFALARIQLADSDDYPWGMFLSVTCTNDVPRIDEAEIEPAVRGTFLGDYRVRQQQEACRRWAKPRKEHQALHSGESKVPALLITGRYDPVTPPEISRRLAASLPNSADLVFEAGHVFNWVSCIDGLMHRFFETASTAGITASCQPDVRSYDFEIP